jgi:CDP-diacylglycerol--glycerol-3-phosphate 3-phosphatidyltransferase
MTELSDEPRAQQQTLTERLRAAFRPLVEGVARGVMRLGLGADILTVLGALVTGAAGYFAARGQYVMAGLVIALGGPFDALDGTVARLRGSETRFGAMLDSTLDRYAEALIFVGLGYHMARGGQWVGLILSFVALFGSVMVSYSRARSEGLGVANKGGLMSRVERLVVLALALLTGQVMIGLWLLAILTHVTVAQRVWRVYRATRANVPGVAHRETHQP